MSKSLAHTPWCGPPAVAVMVWPRPCLGSRRFWWPPRARFGIVEPKQRALHFALRCWRGSARELSGGMPAPNSTAQHSTPSTSNTSNTRTTSTSSTSSTASASSTSTNTSGTSSSSSNTSTGSTPSSAEWPPWPTASCARPDPHQTPPGWGSSRGHGHHQGHRTRAGAAPKSHLQRAVPGDPRGITSVRLSTRGPVPGV